MTRVEKNPLYFRHEGVNEWNEFILLKISRVVIWFRTLTRSSINSYKNQL